MKNNSLRLRRDRALFRIRTRKSKGRAEVRFALTILIGLLVGCGPGGDEFRQGDSVSAYVLPKVEPKEGSYEVRYDSGQLKAQGTYDSLKEWYENGRLRREIKFLDGQIDGLYQSWHENGARHIWVNYLAGERDGHSYEWHENGQIKEASIYKNGKPDGEYLGWFFGGEKKFTARYVDGKIEGLLLEFTSDGEVASRKHYKEGVLMSGEKI